jgi:hypothetical protein
VSEIRMVRHEACMGRGYVVENRQRKRGNGIYIRTCRGCNGSGQVPEGRKQRGVRKPRTPKKWRTSQIALASHELAIVLTKQQWKLAHALIVGEKTHADLDAREREMLDTIAEKVR